VFRPTIYLLDLSHCLFVSLMPRSRLGPLALEAKLGDHPSQSLVWRAVHVNLHRAVAVKVFPTPFGGTAEGREAFAEEWEFLKRLQHPAIAKCYGGGFEETDAYLAFELVDGDTLAQLIERRGRLQWDAVLDFAIPIAEALAAAHAMGICHGAISPSKIMISGLSPILIDFRIDRVHTIYRNSRAMTVLEMALQPPEVATNPAAISPRGDIYSLGAVMFYALTGRPPISGETIAQVIQNSASEIPPKAASLVLDCPVWVSTVIQQTLEKDPQSRPHDAKALAMSLIEARHRSSGLSSVAEHASSGFSPLQMTKQKDKDEARKLLGRDALNDLDETKHSAPIHEQAWFLIGALGLIMAFLGWLVWPLSESQLRARAEVLIAEDNRSSLEQAKNSFLIPLLKKFPSGEHAQWAADQLDTIDMIQTEHALSVKLKRNMRLSDEGERLYAEALRFEQFGDPATALGKYKSMETLLANQSQYKTYVNLARRQIAKIHAKSSEVGEAARIVQAKMVEADRLFGQGNVVAARNIWYSVVELYGDNADVAPFVQSAQQRLGGVETNPSSNNAGKAE
jgi:eukaryotic-like serine/threonine-protein kinase